MLELKGTVAFLVGLALHVLINLCRKALQGSDNLHVLFTVDEEGAVELQELAELFGNPCLAVVDAQLQEYLTVGKLTKYPAARVGIILVDDKEYLQFVTTNKDMSFMLVDVLHSLVEEVQRCIDYTLDVNFYRGLLV